MFDQPTHHGSADSFCQALQMSDPTPAGSVSGKLRIGEHTGTDHTRNGSAVTLDPASLCTHGVIVGMTGSGKTGLGISLLEEALNNGVAVLAIYRLRPSTTRHPPSPRGCCRWSASSPTRCRVANTCTWPTSSRRHGPPARSSTSPPCCGARQAKRRQPSCRSPICPMPNGNSSCHGYCRSWSPGCGRRRARRHCACCSTSTRSAASCRLLPRRPRRLRSSRC